MKDEGDPITPDEWLVRLIWGEFLAPADALPVRPVAFRPRPDETDGISMFRLACVSRAEDVLAVIAPEKQPRYAITIVSVTELVSLGLTVKPARIETAPGHVVIPELNSINAKVEKKRLEAIQIRLAEIANQNLVRRPLE
ncbi:MAG TPA: hypothetical protein VFG68_04550 [Fimbriiglobus sp.]|nr:hypothetical protein [Fimbriiglobus sp.]